MKTAYDKAIETFNQSFNGTTIVLNDKTEHKIKEFLKNNDEPTDTNKLNLFNAEVIVSGIDNQEDFKLTVPAYTEHSHYMDLEDNNIYFRSKTIVDKLRLDKDKINEIEEQVIKLLALFKEGNYDTANQSYELIIHNSYKAKKVDLTPYMAYLVVKDPIDTEEIMENVAQYISRVIILEEVKNSYINLLKGFLNSFEWKEKHQQLIDTQDEKEVNLTLNKVEEVLQTIISNPTQIVSKQKKSDINSIELEEVLIQYGKQEPDNYHFLIHIAEYINENSPESDLDKILKETISELHNSFNKKNSSKGITK